MIRYNYIQLYIIIFIILFCIFLSIIVFTFARGNHLNVGSIADDNTSQHRGFGKRLIAKAEAIAKENRFKKIAIISGVGVRDYYRKQGYYLENSFMMKELDISNRNNNNGYFSPARMIFADIVIAIAGDILQSFVGF